MADTHLPLLFRIYFVGVRYDTRCYFNVRSKADMSSLIYCMETTKKCKTEKLKSKNGYAQK